MAAELNFDVAIVGAGVAGLALARALAPSGLRLALVDAGPEPHPPRPDAAFAGRVSALTVASVRFLTELEAWDGQVQEAACPFTDMRVWDAEGTGSVHFAAADVFQTALGWIVANSVINAGLAAALAGKERVTLLRQAAVQELDGATGGERVLSLADGRRLRARLVVGADGSRSRVRDVAGCEVKEWDYGHQAIVTAVRCAEPHRFTAWQRFLPSGPLAFLPLLDPGQPSASEQHHVSIVWSCHPSLAAELMNLDEAAFRARLAEAFERRLGDIDQVWPRHAFPLRQIHARDYVDDGLALIGDAAHTIHPLAGQGINLGLLDARVLADVLRDAAIRGEDFGCRQVLSRYQRRRKGHNLGMMALMEGFKRLFESDDLMLRWLRNSGFNTVDRLPVLKRQLMSRAMGL